MVPFKLVVLFLDNRYNVSILADKNVDASDLFQLIHVLYNTCLKYTYFLHRLL